MRTITIEVPAMADGYVQSQGKITFLHKTKNMGGKRIGGRWVYISSSPATFKGNTAEIILIPR